MRYFVLVLLLAGCTDLFGPDLTFWNRRPMDPVPEVYATWYAEVEECLGRSGDFGAVRWFVADSIAVDGRTKGGITDGDEITIWRVFAERSGMVRHESAHHITGTGDALHDDLGHVPCA